MVPDQGKFAVWPTSLCSDATGWDHWQNPDRLNYL
jgi:hypothetical protein